MIVIYNDSFCHTCAPGCETPEELTKMTVYHDEIEIEDFEYDEETETYHYPCPCGDRFEITKVTFGLILFQVYPQATLRPDY